MTELVIEPLHERFGARVRGLDLTAGPDPGTVELIHRLVDEHSVLCLPDQPMTDDAQFALTQLLGEPEENHVTFGRTGERVYFGTIGNVVDEATSRDNDDPATRYQRGNELWHSDSSFREIPSYVSILHAYEVPGEGGDTLFASMRTAYEDLPPAMQDEIDPLLVLHDYVFSRSQVAPVDPNHAASLPPVVNRLVRTNPANGRRNYYVGSHARSIVGWSGVDSRRLIDDLNARATVEANVYRHRWAAGDTVIWDNRTMLHRGGGYDATRWRRHLRQTRVRGAGPTLAEQAPVATTA
ncbi:MAG: TauD/TfdA family dioxygenase [Actinomycetota bacterium]|nr:TauD/TfdA family dioxygenase [Actinomycetota bacterium]